MSKIFLTIVNMSISASYLALAVMLLRLLLRKAPKWITVLLWGIVAVRLVCPVFIESEVSLIPRNEWIKPPETQMSQPIEPDNIVVDPSLGENVIVNYPQNEPNITFEKGIDIPLVLGCVWLTGIAALLVYTAVSYIVLKRRVGRAVRLRDNIYQSENVVSPFVLGFIKPRIYLPFNIDGKDMGHVVAHEKAHIRRKDHLWKPMGFILLAVHWFNPLMWLGYILLCRDIELACDEKVVKELDREARADYSEALLTCSVNRRMIAACPIAFGEVGVKGRVKSVLNYKKPAFWIILTAVVICLAVVICFLTDPIDMENIGIKSIAIEKADTNTFDLKLKYSFPSGSYSIENVQKDEGEYCGDGLVEYDGALGNYRILIKFGDTELSKELREKYPAGEVVELENAPIKTRIKCVYPQDHGVYIYVGFEKSVIVGEIEEGKLNSLGGTVKIQIQRAEHIIPDAAQIIYLPLPTEPPKFDPKAESCTYDRYVLQIVKETDEFYICTLNSNKEADHMLKKTDFEFNVGDFVVYTGKYQEITFLQGCTTYVWYVLNENSEESNFEIVDEYTAQDHITRIYLGELKVAKPVIYLYPEEETVCSVKVNIEGKLICTYPEHGDNGWQNFTVSPDGTIVFPDGQRYYCLYWEGETYNNADFSSGFCVKGQDTAEFLTNVLSEIGLSYREANEFIIYWLPLMQDNEYNVISFNTDAYVGNSSLEITPAPDSLLRVFMTYYSSDTPIEIEPQEFDDFERNGFTVIEWGGSCVIETK